ncbi:MAG TPA: FAD-binding oxidoreductase, partial [Spirochaetota bacterium]|nr:FAD-binding oxidoreductase [Spirochaetota bacterium]
MTKKNNEFQPDWTETAPPENSYRSIFKWGAPDGFKHPNAKLFKELKETFGLSDAHFKGKQPEGNETVTFKKAVKLSKTQVRKLASIAGEENISSR